MLSFFSSSLVCLKWFISHKLVKPSYNFDMLQVTLLKKNHILKIHVFLICSVVDDNGSK